MIRRIWSLLDARQRVVVSVLFIMMVIAMMLEMVGIGLVVPAVGLMNGPLSDQSAPVAAILNRVGNPSQKVVLMCGLGVIMAVYLLKTGFILVYNFFLARFVASLQTRLSNRLFSTYMRQPWTFHLERNSSTLIRNVNELNNVGMILLSVMGAIAEAFVLIGVLALLVWSEPLATLVIAGVLGISTLVILKLTARRTRVWGELRFTHWALMNRHLQQGLGGIKDARIRGVEKLFVDRFSQENGVTARFGVLQQIALSVPRLWLELMAVGAICFLTATLLWQGRTPEEVVPSLALFAIAAFRMVPATNRIATAVQTLRFAKKPLSVITEELDLPDGSGTSCTTPLTFHDEVVVDNVTFRFPSSSTPALDGVTLRFGHGQSVGVIGGSGAGKSTAVDVLLGLLDPTLGRVTVDGVDIRGNMRGWQSIVGYVPQSIYLCDESLRGNVAFGVPPDQVDDDALRRAIIAARLDAFVASLPNGLDTVVGERGVRLSGGQRQRIGIARALYHDPQVLVLDEATSALDTETEAEVMAAVNSLHGTKTMIIVAHRLSTVEQCDVLYRLEKGRVVRVGPFAEVVQS